MSTEIIGSLISTVNVSSLKCHPLAIPKPNPAMQKAFLKLPAAPYVKQDICFFKFLVASFFVIEII